MRIGRIIIDTDNMTVEEMDCIINEMSKIRNRKKKAEQYMRELTELLNEAKADGFTFIDKDFGNVLTPADFTIFDEQ